MYSPEQYHAWYQTARGAWIGRLEFETLRELIPEHVNSLLDVGCGTGYFSKLFAYDGFSVTGIDPDSSAIIYARSLSKKVKYLEGSALALPFKDQSFDMVTAITSLCFIRDPDNAFKEMWRVAKTGVLLGLLNRQSLLFIQKAGKGGYKDARWDTWKDIREWTSVLKPTPLILRRNALFLPDGGKKAKIMEKVIPNRLPYGGFLAVALLRP